MKNLEQQLKRLAGLARQAPEMAAVEMPLGFDTRVLALAAWPDEEPGWLAWEKLAPRSLAAAALVCLCAVLAGMWSEDTGSVNEMQMATAIIENLIHP